jgi:lipopolysaccharide/colanic/teichoic acid biosynthesis glycosyltransferase
MTRRRRQARSATLAVKRILDVLVAGTLTVLLSPLLLVVAVAIKLQSRGPVFFRQRRSGLHGQTFVILKFRSMVRDAEDGGPVLSMNDDRVTRIGRFLRSTSLDEIPQLINVLRGEMSLVGPRPQLPQTTRPGEERRLEMRPGMTGLVEVSDPHLLSWDERMRLDVEYVERWSLRLDLSILLRTIPVVFSRKDILDLPRL